MAFWNQTQQTITINDGTYPNDGTGDPIRNAFVKVNNNFANISAFLGAAEGDGNVSFQNLQVPGILNANTANVVVGNLIVSNVYGPQNYFGNLNVNGSIVPEVPGTYDLGSISNKFRNVYVGNVISSNQTTISSDSGILKIHANANPGDQQDTGILGNITSDYTPTNTYAFFGHQFTTNDFIYKITNIDTSGSGNNVVSGGFYGNVHFGSAFLSNATPGGNTLIVAGNTAVAGNIIATANLYAGGYQVLTTNNIGYYGSPLLGGIVTGQASFTAAGPSVSTGTGAVVITNGGLGVYGNINAGAIYGPYYGTIANPAQPNITSLGTIDNLSANLISAQSLSINSISATNINTNTLTGLSLLSVASSITTATVNASTIGNAGTTLTGTLNTSAQPNITSVGKIGRAHV